MADQWAPEAGDGNLPDPSLGEELVCAEAEDAEEEEKGDNAPLPGKRKRGGKPRRGKRQWVAVCNNCGSIGHGKDDCTAEWEYCWRCGSMQHPPWDCKQYMEHQCTRCKRVGHSEERCLSKTGPTNQERGRIIKGRVYIRKNRNYDAAAEALNAKGEVPKHQRWEGDTAHWIGEDLKPTEEAPGPLVRPTVLEKQTSVKLISQAGGRRVPDAEKAWDEATSDEEHGQDWGEEMEWQVPPPPGTSEGEDWGVAPAAEAVSVAGLTERYLPESMQPTGGSSSSSGSNDPLPTPMPSQATKWLSMPKSAGRAPPTPGSLPVPPKSASWLDQVVPEK